MTSSVEMARLLEEARGRNALRYQHKVGCPDDDRLIAAVVVYEGARYVWTRGGREGNLAHRRYERRIAPERIRRGIDDIAADRDELTQTLGDQAYAEALEAARRDLARAELIAELPSHAEDLARWHPSANLIHPGDKLSVMTACRSCKRRRVVVYDERTDTLKLTR